ncbi:MAG: DEAD/DEAH box helicase [Ignavibacteriales bacterium]|nr:DEAD/DEAH box helicase [Ignavibacteriales bacterium]
MAEAIADALLGKRHLLIEAPTGVGKSLAYLVPAILFAKKENRKAIVSTHTKNLQEQLLKKDLAVVRSLLNEPFDAVVFKGRGNYLCTTRLRNALRQQQLFDNAELDELQRIKKWSLQSTDGDLDELPFSPSQNVRQQVCSEKGACSPKTCAPDCFFQKARSRARTADLVIMNHALFFTLFAMQESEEFFIFKNDFVIFDEAHTLEQVAGTAVGKSISHSQVLFAIHRLYNPRTKKGLFARLKTTRFRKLCEKAEDAANSFFDKIGAAAEGLAGRSNTVRVRAPFIVDDTVTKSLRELRSAVKELQDDKRTKLAKMDLAAADRLIWEAEILIQEFLGQPDRSLTYWVELSGRRFPKVYLRTAPTSVAERIGSKLFKDGTSVIMTGATLSVGGSMAYFQNRMGASDVESLLLDSPFDYLRQMRLTITSDIPSPDRDGYESALPEFLYRSLIRSQGKALVLFTNTRLMRASAEILRSRIEAEGYTLLVQSEGRGRHQLLEQFKADVHSILFGLDSFWMGVDVPGEALEHVIITKLPFSVPAHPLVESRMEMIVQRGGDAFLDYTLPEAVLKFKQGVGRLIRSRTDRGLITILDSRIVTKSYGRSFLQSLPSCPIEVMRWDGTIEELYDDGVTQTYTA